MKKLPFTSKEREELTKLARVAGQVPSTDFWDEVKERMAVRDDSVKIEKRNLKD